MSGQGKEKSGRRLGVGPNLSGSAPYSLASIPSYQQVQFWSSHLGSGDGQTI